MGYPLGDACEIAGYALTQEEKAGLNALHYAIQEQAKVSLSDLERHIRQLGREIAITENMTIRPYLELLKETTPLFKGTPKKKGLDL